MIPLPVTKDLKIDTVMNTIRFIIISLTAAVAAVSCTKNEMEGYGYGDGRIGFIGNPGDAFTRGMPVESVADIHIIPATEPPITGRRTERQRPLIL